jgi:hypothetical protein
MLGHSTTEKQNKCRLSSLFRQLPMFPPRKQKKHFPPESLNVSFKLHSCISQKAVMLRKDILSLFSLH